MASSLADFTFIEPGIFLYTPQRSMTGQPILLGIWLGAVYWHTAEYTILYRCITPTARIWLLESSFGILISAFVLNNES